MLCVSVQKVPKQLVVIPVCYKMYSKIRTVTLLIKDTLCKLQISNLDAKLVELPSE